MTAEIKMTETKCYLCEAKSEIKCFVCKENFCGDCVLDTTNETLAREDEMVCINCDDRDENDEIRCSECDHVTSEFRTIHDVNNAESERCVDCCPGVIKCLKCNKYRLFECFDLPQDFGEDFDEDDYKECLVCK